MKRKSSAQIGSGNFNNNNINLNNFFTVNKSKNEIGNKNNNSSEKENVTNVTENKNKISNNNTKNNLKVNTDNKESEINSQIAKEVKLARTNRELSLINKGIKNNSNSNNNKSLFRPLHPQNNNREILNNTIFPIIIKTGLGVYKEILNVNEIKRLCLNCLKNIITISNSFIELNIDNSKEYKSEECINLTLNNNNLGYISKDISKILYNVLKFESVKHKIILDKDQLEIYIIVTLIASESYQIYNEQHVNEKVPTENNNNINFMFYKIKSSYMIPIECVKVLIQMSSHDKNISEKLYTSTNLENFNMQRLNEFFYFVKETYWQEFNFNHNYDENNNFESAATQNFIKNGLGPNEKINNYENINFYDENENEFETDEKEEDKQNNNYNHFLLSNIENILSMTENYNFLFKTKELRLIEDYKRELNEVDKEVFSKFLTRSSLWLGKKKLVNLFTNNQNNNLFQKYRVDQIEKSIEKLNSLKFIKNAEFILDDEKENNDEKDSENCELIEPILNSFTNNISTLSENNTSKFKSELFTFLYYLTNEDIKLIQKELTKLTKNNPKLEDNEKLVEEIFINNSFYRIDKFMDYQELKNLSKICSYEISQHNFVSRKDQNKDKDLNKFFGYLLNNSTNSGPNIKYISTFLNSTNFKKVKISKINFTQKMGVIVTVIKTIDQLLNDKSSNIMNNFLLRSSKNTIGSIITGNKTLKEKIVNILKQFHLFSLNMTFAKLFDCASRLFFFYSDYRDINHIAKEFYGFENFEKFENFVTNKEEKSYLRPIFLTMKDFKLYDNLYQIKTSYLINSMIFNNNNLNYFIVKNFAFFLMNVNNENIFTMVYEGGKNILNNNVENNFNNCDYILNNNIDKICENSPNQILLKLLLDTNFHYVEKDFLYKYKYGYIAAELLNHFAEACEKNKNYKFASLIFMFLLLNNYLSKKRGLWWYRLILILNKYLKNKFVCVKLLNKALTDPFIKSGYLVKIKQYYERFEKEKNKMESKNKLIQEKETKKKKEDVKKKEAMNKKEAVNKKEKEYLNELEIYPYINAGNNNIVNNLSLSIANSISENSIYNNQQFIYDEKLFLDKIRTINADSVYSKYNGRRLYNLNNIQTNTNNSNTLNIITTVEDFAIEFYKTLHFKGVHGENMILPALYNIFFWDIIYYDKIPYVFQSPYQVFPLDFFSDDFYLNRKELIEDKLLEISFYTEEDIKNTFEHIYTKKKNIKTVFISWGSNLNDRELLEKITYAITVKRLALIFREFSRNLKFMVKGMPDLFLWKEEEDNNFNKTKKVIEGSGLLVEVKSKNDKLSEHQKYWLSFLVMIKQDVEILHIE